MTKRDAIMTRATKNPPPDRAGKTGLTWALCALVRRGSVDGGTGRRPPIGAIVVEVVVVVEAAVVGTVNAGRRTRVGGTGRGGVVTGRVVTGTVVGGRVVTGTVRVTGGFVTGGFVTGVVGVKVPVTDTAAPAGVAGLPGPEIAVASTAAAAAPRTTLSTVTDQRGTAPSLTALRPGWRHGRSTGPQRGAVGGAGRTIWSPGKSRLRSARLGRTARFTCTTRHQ
jgi:hypothetical protein